MLAYHGPLTGAGLVLPLAAFLVIALRSWWRGNPPGSTSRRMHGYRVDD